MLNQIAVQMMNFLLNGILLDPSEAGFNNIPEDGASGDGGAVAASCRCHWAIHGCLRGRVCIGVWSSPIVLAVIIYIFLWRTSLGYRIRAVGENQRASSFRRHQRQAADDVFDVPWRAGLPGWRASCKCWACSIGCRRTARRRVLRVRPDSTVSWRRCLAG